MCQATSRSGRGKKGNHACCKLNPWPMTYGSSDQITGIQIKTAERRRMEFSFQGSVCPCTLDPRAGNVAVISKFVFGYLCLPIYLILNT